MTVFSESALPVLIGSLPAGQPKGDVPALGRLTINEAQAVDQWWMTYGLETNDDYAHTDSTGSGALFYEAETRTALGGSATAVGPSGASGAGSNVMRNTALTTSYQAVVSTQATGGGAHLTHVGQFKVYARVQAPTSNTGGVQIAFEWAHGDFRRPTRNETVDLYPDTLAPTGWNGAWRLADLGLVNIPKPLSGAQRWEGRLLAKSTVLGDDIDVDCLLLIPTGAGHGVVSAQVQTAAPTVWVSRDEFDQTAGALVTKVAPVGGTWAGGGDADDFSVETTGHTVQRTATTDTFPVGRVDWAPTSLTATAVQADVKNGTPGAAGYTNRLGVAARVVDASNYLAAELSWVDPSNNLSWLRVSKMIAGAFTTIGSVKMLLPAFNVWFTVKLIVDAAGRFWFGCAPQGQPITSWPVTGQDAVLATGGTLAAGFAGIYDHNPVLVTGTRSFDNFQAWAPTADAAVFASQSLEIRHDGVIREDSAGAIWQPASTFEGDLLRVPVTGREGRSVRFIVKACRNDPATGPDAGIDDINATLAVQPRFLSVPVPA